MNTLEREDYFSTNFCSYDDADKVVAILDAYTQKQIVLTDINRVFELYHTKLFFEKVHSIPKWPDEKYNEYQKRTLNLKEVVYDYFKSITEKVIVDDYKSCNVVFRDDFRKFFYLFKTYKCISKNKICEILIDFRWNPFQILEDKEFVDFFDDELTHLLENPNIGVPFIISFYLEEHTQKQKVYIPRSFGVKKRIKLIEDYLQKDTCNPNNLQLIVNSKHTNELPITPKMKKLADRKNTEFWENNKETHVSEYEISVSFGPYEKVKNVRLKNKKWIFEYGTNWIKNNTDYPTLLNNFIYLFEYVDIQMRCSYISNNYNEKPLTDIFIVKGKGMYKKDSAFDMLDALSDIQMMGYVKELKKLEVDIEDIIKWFFEDYLYNEFGINNYVCNMPNSSDSILSKCKTLASAIDGVLSKYKLYCDDGEIDMDLFAYITNSPRIKDVPSMVTNKYCYVNSDELSKEMNMLFSNQSILSYTEKTGSIYDTFVNLVTHEKIKFSECKPYNLQSLNWLLIDILFILKMVLFNLTEREYAFLRNFMKKVLYHCNILLLYN